MVDFKIEITSDRVIVSHTQGGWPPDLGTTTVFTVLSGLAVYATTKVFSAQDVWLYPSNLPLLLVMTLFAGSLLWAALRSLFPSGQSLTCDRNTLTIGRIPQNSLRGQWRYESFPLSEVKDLKFASVAFGGRTPVLGVRFKVNGETRRSLAGLESPEAATILNGLAALGANVVRDPAMPMMVETALSRRKHFGGAL